jgi:hypothetical protein
MAEKEHPLMVAVQKIKKADYHELENREFLIGCVCDAGLMDNRNMPDSKDLYGKYHEHASIDGTIWQRPEEFVDAMLYLRDKEITSFCEIGVWRGGSFALLTAYLSHFGLNKAWAIDKFAGTPTVGGVPWRLMKFDIVDTFRKYYPHSSYIIGESHQFAGEKFDFVFIDGDHSHRGVQADWGCLGKHAKYAMFHDIQEERWAKGVVTFWERKKELDKQLREELPQRAYRDMKEFISTEGDPGHMGIGIIEV